MATVSSPSTQISPAFGRRRPMMFLRSTDLPVPEGPITEVICPRGMSKLMSRSTVFDPNDLVPPRSELTASSGTPPPGGATWWDAAWPRVGAPPSLVRRPSDALLPTRRDVCHTVPAQLPAQPHPRRQPSPLFLCFDWVLAAGWVGVGG